MTTAYDRLFHSVFTKVEPERAHHAAFRAIRAAERVMARLPRALSEPVEAMGLHFPAPLGLAAGFDKNAEGIDALAVLGFGFIEIGTVTAQAQPGNPRPRLFRLPKDGAIVNRMGFNNDGAVAVARRLEQRSSGKGGGEGRPLVGINIGKTKVVPEDDVDAVVSDYRSSARLLSPYADYLVVNVSSPNTPGLRSLQAIDRLGPILAAVRDEADRAAGRTVPLLVKIAPDLEDPDALDVVDLSIDEGLQGLIAVNTTLSRDNLLSSPGEVAAAGDGGLSGRPLRGRANQLMTALRERAGDRLTLVGVGGISTAEDAAERLAAGADLLQAYTGFVYGGPFWPARVNAALARGEEAPWQDS